MLLRQTLTTLLLTAGLFACNAPQRAPSSLAPSQPESASGWSPKPGWAYPRQAVAAANPLATAAGWQILKAGGSAVDAAIAVQMVLGLVEPQSSGIGGGAFLMVFDGQRISAWDGRETAPALATPDMFLGPDGQPLSFDAAVLSGHAVGVPGAVRMLEAAHRQHGQLPWAQLFKPAMDLAEQGFAVSARLNNLLQSDPYLRQDPLARSFYYNAQAQAWPVGHVLRNPEYAHVLRRLSIEGSKALHEGPVAQAIVARVAQPPHAGRLRLQDLRDYQSREREPLCFAHAVQQRHFKLCGFPPPSSGHVAIGQILGMLAHTTADGPELQDGIPSPDFVHRYTQASRLAFADRAQYLADPEFVDPPAGDWRSLLGPAYLQQRSRLIGPRAMTTAPAGQPGNVGPLAMAPMPDQVEHGTSHISVVDAQGRAVAMTTTIESAFGSRRMVSTDPARPGGFLLNNQLTDFSLTPTDGQGRLVANRVEPGKRPRSAMSPTLVFDQDTGKFLMTGGSPGGAIIIHYTAKLLLGTLHWQLNTQEAINLPNMGVVSGPTFLETGRFPPSTVQALTARGHRVLELELTSGLQAIEKTPQGWFGGADPRREGVVLGD
jgi:gamma-glutamyltranspeptidase/glutathione hydrolase